MGLFKTIFGKKNKDKSIAKPDDEEIVEAMVDALETDTSAYDDTSKMQMAKSLEKVGNIEAAISLYEELVRNKFKGGAPYNRLLVIYKREKRYDDLRRVVDLAIENQKKLHASMPESSGVKKKLDQLIEKKAKFESLH